MIVKCGRTEFDLDETDLIYTNGFCYQILTKRTNAGWDWSFPIIAKSKAVKMIKQGLLVETKRKISLDGSTLIYYKIKKDPE